MKHFDKQAQNWDNDPMKVERAMAFAKEINGFIKPNQKLNALEFGCGTGLLSFYLKDYFKTITLTDNSEGMIRVLNEKIKKENIKNFKPLFIDLFIDDLKTQFDVIYTLMTLHHISDLNKMLRIFSSLLKTSGYLCIADLVAEDGSFHSEHADFNGHNGFDRKILSTLLSENGFHEEYYNLCFEIEKEKDNKKTKYPLFLMIAKKDKPD
jgi:2-polyprenyl-3-methyl-5-hydroxy-6-metoxy-1,4-benzoquinol methylase